MKHHTYDGHGRLIRTQSPWPEPDVEATEVRSERFYYDGIRRIQEVVIDPVMTLQSAAASGDPELLALHQEATEGAPEPLDESAAPMMFEEGQMAGGGGGGGSYVTYLNREYIWGPGDAGRGDVDELLVQYDKNRGSWWVIQDSGGDVVALCDLLGTGATARVAAQWTYDAYGAVLSADHLYPHAYMHCGHKGLFFDRLDGGVGNGGSGINLEPPRLIPFAHYVYQIRNRAYSPGLGRFFQRDPNATAMTLLAASNHHGRGMGAISIAFDMESMYGDGMNLYEYLGSNPWQRRDPLGLSWDPFDIVDDYLAESSGAVAALLSQLGQNAHAAAVLTATIASYLPFPIVGSLGDMALYALGEQSGEALAMGVMIGMVPGGKLAGFIGKMASSAFSTAFKYAKKFGAPIIRNFLNPLGSLAGRISNWLARKPAGSCCFVGDTLVWTNNGFVPIRDIEVGDLVQVEDEVTGEQTFRPVLVKHVVSEASVVEMTLLHEAGADEIIRVSDEHPFWQVGFGWTRADSLAPESLIRTDAGVAIVRSSSYGSDRVVVYDITVEGHPNYFVGTNGAWVHNCSLKARHHFLPRKFKDKFQAAGINIEAYAKDVDAGWHKAIHDGREPNGAFNGGPWNLAWESFWSAYPKPTRGNPSVHRVEEYLESLKGRFDADAHIIK